HVWRGLLEQASDVSPALEEGVEPLDFLVSPVGIRDGVYHHYQILAYAPDHRLLRYRQPIGQLLQRLRGSGLIRVKRRVEVVDRTGARHDTLGGGGVRGARIRQRGSRGSEPLQLLDALFVRDRDHHDVTAFFRTPDREQAHARGRARERATVPIGGRGI